MLGTGPQDYAIRAAMTYKLGLKRHGAAVKTADRASNAVGGRRIYRLGRHWAVAVNAKIIAAVGLALLVWAAIAALVLAL